MTAKAVIFDMDGVIIDSESLWQTAQISALKTYGITVSAQQCEKYTMGKRIDEISRVWIQELSLMVDPKALESEIIYLVSELIISNGKAMDGLYETLDYFKEEKYKIALATSSSHKIIDIVFDKLKLWSYFEVISSAENEKHGKPDPAVYKTTIKKLKLYPEECLVIEDSLNGLISAKNAGIPVYIVSHDFKSEKFSDATGRYATLVALAQSFREKHI